MKYIDDTGQGNTLLILTGAESLTLRALLGPLEHMETGKELVRIFNRGIERGTAKMDWEFKKK